MFLPLTRSDTERSPCPAQLRHPNILQFKDTAEVEERGETVIYLVTEACTPLADHLQRLDIQVPLLLQRQPSVIGMPESFGTC